MSLWNSSAGNMRRSESTSSRPRSQALESGTRGSIITLIILGTLLSFITAPSEASFVTTPSYATGVNTVSVTVGDFNEDGIPDVATVGSSGVSILLGKGDGTFQPTQTFAAGPNPQAVAVGDFNRDGHADLAVVNINTLSILLGNGDGTFQANQSYGGGGLSVAVGDFNHDGIPDLAVANGSGSGLSGLSVLLGNGDGTFQPAQKYTSGPDTSFVAVGDLKGGGNVDVVVVNRGVGTVSVLLGNGDGTFQAPQSYAAGTQPGTQSESVAAADFNGDGIPDLAVAYYANGGGGLSVLLGNGDGSFQAAQSYGVGAGVFGGPVAVADFNRDGHLDVAVAGGFASAAIILLGNGDGTFQYPKTYAAGSFPYSLAVADFNGDGFPDLAVADYSFDGYPFDHPGAVSVLLGNGDGTFQGTPSYQSGAYPTCGALGDFNGDGILDFAVGNYGGTVSVFLGKGDGTFQLAQTFPCGPGPTFLAVSDLNGDGKEDIVITRYLLVSYSRHDIHYENDVRVFLGNGDGTFQSATILASGSRPLSVAVGDLNGDGTLDLAVVNNWSDTVTIYLGNGDGTFRAVQSYVVGSGPSAVAIRDFNGDGIPDLAVVNEESHSWSIPNGTVSILLGKGDGTFRAAQTYAVGFDPKSVAVGDFNGDGIPDLAVANLALPANGGPSVSVLLGNGDGTFQPAQNYTVGPYASFVTVGDFNRDGHLDIAVAAGPGASVLLGNGDGTFQPAQNYAAGSGHEAVAAADFNGDGFVDLIVVNHGYTVTVLLNTADWGP